MLDAGEIGAQNRHRGIEDLLVQRLDSLDVYQLRGDELQAPGDVKLGREHLLSLSQLLICDFQLAGSFPQRPFRFRFHLTTEYISFNGHETARRFRSAFIPTALRVCTTARPREFLIPARRSRHQWPRAEMDADTVAQRCARERGGAARKVDRAFRRV